MAYRKITVNGKEYQYSIGRTHTAIRGMGAWPNERVGALVFIPFKDGGMWGRNQLRITPKHVAELIRTPSTPKTIPVVEEPEPLPFWHPFAQFS